MVERNCLETEDKDSKWRSSPKELKISSQHSGGNFSEFSAMNLKPEGRERLTNSGTERTFDFRV